MFGPNSYERTWPHPMPRNPERGKTLGERNLQRFGIMSFLLSTPNASLIDLFKTYPELARLLHEFAQTLMRDLSPFAEAQRALIAAYVSALNGCDFCYRSHVAVAERFAIPAGLVDKLVEDPEGVSVPENLKTVLRLVRKLNNTPAEVARADIDAVLAAGWNETAVVHAILVCGFFNLMNRWVEGLGIKADPAAVRMASHHLHSRGYRGVFDLLQRQPAEEIQT